MDSEPGISMSSKSSVVWIAALVVVLAGLAGSNAYLFWTTGRMEEANSKWRASMATGISQLREQHAVALADQNRRLESLAAQLGAAHRQVSTTVSRSRREAEQMDARLAQLSQDQQRHRQQLSEELTRVNEAATAANTKIGDVTTDVSTVKTEVAVTRSELEKTASELKRVTGDLGVMSGLIATNSRELAALKELGERNYFEFNLTKAKLPQKIGNVQALVKKTDPKRNRYTIEIIADDKRVEKKDKTINEPVQFYVARSRQPYEIVVNEVRSDRLIGYLAAPKLQLALK